MSETVAAPPEHFNFAQHLITINEARAAKTAYIDDTGAMTYGELAERIRRCATGLRALGLRREERLLLLMQDSIDWPVAFLGALYAGIVPVAVNTLLTVDDYAYMLAHSRAQAAIVSGALLPLLQAAMERGGHEIHSIVVSRGPQELPAGAQDCHAWLGQQAPAIAPAHTLADDMGFWLYSSGSTGRPKGTVHAQGSLYWTAQLYGKPVLGLSEHDVTFSAAKLFFAYGLGNALSFPLSVGATVVLMAERPTPDACFKRMTGDVGPQGAARRPPEGARTAWGSPALYKPTVFFGAPTGFAGLLASPHLPSRDQVALRLCSSAGEALPKELGERFTAHFGCHIIDGIGSTEMLHIFLSNRPGEVRYGTTGKPVPGYELELRDDSGRVITGHDEVGDLYVKGPSSALLYWGNRTKSRDTFQGAWTKTGDKYTRDRDGYYVYAGRGDDMLKVSGQYVSPFEVESTLMQHEAVLEAAVIGVNDEQGLMRAKAFVVLKNATLASDELCETLKTFVKVRLAPHKYPRQLEFVTELPKTATGKIQRFRLREREQART
jgi:benzoate-CoA ligase